MIDGVDFAVGLFASSLRVISLNCGNMSGDLLTALATELQQCKHLMKLSLFDISYDISDDEVEIICTMHDELEELYLDGDKFAMEGADTLVLSVLQDLPHLRRFELGLVAEAGPGLQEIDEICAYCPDITFISTPRFRIDMVRGSLETFQEEYDLSLWQRPLRRLSGHLTSKDDVETLLSSFVTTLEALELTIHPTIQDIELVRLVSQCANLSELSLKNCCKLSDNVLSSVGLSCKALRRLEINGSKRFTEKNIGFVIQQCPHLYSLKLVQCTMVSDGMWTVLQKYGASLRELTLGNVLMTPQAVVEQLVENRVALLRLQLPHSYEKHIVLALTTHHPAVWRVWKSRLWYL